MDIDRAPQLLNCTVALARTVVGISEIGDCLDEIRLKLDCSGEISNPVIEISLKLVKIASIHEGLGKGRIETKCL